MLRFVQGFDEFSVKRCFARPGYARCGVSSLIDTLEERSGGPQGYARCFVVFIEN